MVSIISLFLSILFLTLSLWGIHKSIKDDTEEGFSLFFIILMATIFINAISPANHIYDLATIRAGDDFIRISREAIQELDKHIEAESLPDSNIVNSDTPTSSFINIKSKYVVDITRRKEEVMNARLSISRRKMWTGAWCVWLWGEE